jgi:hypothetical protein
MKTLMLLLAFLLTGCEQVERQHAYNQTVHSTLIADVEGCKVYKITGKVDHSFYLSKCGNTSTTSEHYQTGVKVKSSHQIDVITEMDRG